MAKNKSNDTPHYEMLYIIPNRFTEDEVKPVVEQVEKQITAKGGVVTYAEDWGKKRFAYPIAHQQHGYYRLLEFDLAPDRLGELDRELKISNDVVRYMIVSKPKRSAEEIKAEKQAAQKRRKEERAARAEAAQPAKAPEPKEKKKDVDLKDLDEKLDKILETDDLL
jgi:small subunit ribosomal protein S6